MNGQLLRIVVVGSLSLLPFVAANAETNERKLVDRGESDPRLKGYRTPEGVRLEIVAEDPVVVNPIALAFAVDGTAYVLEGRKGRNGEGKKTKDVVRVLKDAKGKGVYDSANTCLEGEAASGLLLHDGWMYLCGRGNVRRYRLADLGRGAKAEILVKGFGGVAYHEVSGLTLGPDGWLYISVGAGDHRVEGSDGSRAATVLRTGAVFRCRPDGSRLHPFALGFCNPFRNVAFDALGNVFHNDNDGDKTTGCRLLHVAEGCDFGWRLRPGMGVRADLFRTALNGELPGKMPPMRNLGRGAASGLTIYNDTRFPESYRGLIYAPDAVRKSIRAYTAEPKGATFAATGEFVFFQSDDPLFRPVQMTTGPDGAMYVVDWRSDPSVSGWLGDGKHGRIYRLSWTGTKDEPALPLRPLDSWLKIVRQSDDELMKSLGSEDGNDRTRAQRELVRRGERNRAALLNLLHDDDRPLTARLAAMGVLESFWNEDVQKTFQSVLANADAPLRRVAADALGRNAAKGDASVHESLLKTLNDNDLSLRPSVALAMGRIAAPGAADALVNTLAFDNSGDLYLRNALERALERLGKPGIERLLALAESGVKKDTERVVEVFAGLRTRAAYEGLPVLLKYPHLTVPQRVKLIRSCGNYLLDPAISLDPIAAYLATPAGQEAEVKRAGEELMAARADAPATKKSDK